MIFFLDKKLDFVQKLHEFEKYVVYIYRNMVPMHLYRTNSIDYIMTEVCPLL